LLKLHQGPNYILAKRMQHWRAILTAASGSNVSSNVAPTTATVSVTSNWAFKMGLLGFWRFPPIEIFYQELSNSVMGALLIQDVLNSSSPAKKVSIAQLPNPLYIFGSNQFHGGVFRAGFRFESMGVVSAAFVLAKKCGAPTLSTRPSQPLCALFYASADTRCPSRVVSLLPPPPSHMPSISRRTCGTTYPSSSSNGLPSHLMVRSEQLFFLRTIKHSIKKCCNTAKKMALMMHIYDGNTNVALAHW
jgi:hypothetical protein